VDKHSADVEYPPPPPRVCMRGGLSRASTRPTLNLLLPFMLRFRSECSFSMTLLRGAPPPPGAAAVTQANPFPVPPAYVQALDHKVRAVASLRAALRDAGLDEAGDYVNGHIESCVDVYACLSRVVASAAPAAPRDANDIGTV